MRLSRQLPPAGAGGSEHYIHQCPGTSTFAAVGAAIWEDAESYHLQSSLKFTDASFEPCDFQQIIPLC